MNRFRLLRADEIECRISQISRQGKGLSLLLYKTARTDANLLDETVGEANWQNDFKLVDGVLYGGIAVDMGEGWVWKWDAGVESYTEKEKGRASDAFKRAGFKWGIGRELYTAPFIWVTRCQLEKGESGGWRCNDRFSVREITYNDRQEIQTLVIQNDTMGVEAFRLGAKPVEPEKKPEPKTEEKPKEKPLYICEECGKVIEPYPGKDGKLVSMRAHKMRSEAKFGKLLCLNCINARTDS